MELLRKLQHVLLSSIVLIIYKFFIKPHAEYSDVIYDQLSNASFSNKIEQSSDVFCKKGVLRNFVNSQENTCARVSFLIKLQALRLQLY